MIKSYVMIRMASMLFPGQGVEARAELVDLNYKPSDANRMCVCSLCNLNENENVFHFIAVCLILSGIRKTSFGKIRLDENEFKNLLNGGNWRA
jgi:hypothetical protein